jgi:hypothetical protein
MRVRPTQQRFELRTSRVRVKGVVRMSPRYVSNFSTNTSGAVSKQPHLGKRFAKKSSPRSSINAAGFRLCAEGSWSVLRERWQSSRDGSPNSAESIQPSL